MKVSYFENRFATSPHANDYADLRALAREWSEHERTSDKGAIPLWSPAEYAPGTSRGNANVTHVHALVLDVDDSDAIEPILSTIDEIGLAHWVYSTHSHTDARPKLRVSVPLSRPATGAEWPAVMRSVAMLFPGIDPSRKDAAGMFYLPSCPEGVEPLNAWFDGAALDVDTLLPASSPSPAPARPVDAPPLEAGGITPEVRGFAARTLAEVATAVAKLPFPGSVYPVLNPGAYRVGRYVPHILDRERVIATLLEAVDARDPEGVYREKNARLVERAVDDGSRAPWHPVSWTPLDEVALGKRLVRDHGEHIRFVLEWGKWIEWVDGRWTLLGGEARRWSAVDALVNALGAESEYASPTRAEALMKTRRELGKVRAVTNVLRVAQAQPETHVHLAELDANVHAFATASCVVDLRTGHMHAHDPLDLLMGRANVPYEPYAKAPTWTRFLRDIACGDEDMVRYLRAAVGYTMHGVTSEHVLFFLHGDGANGKSTFLEVLRWVFGDYGTVVPSDALLASRFEQHPTTVAGMHGRRLVATSEIDEGRAWNEALVKQLSGGDQITARRMREDFWEFRPTHTLWIAGNYRPVVRGNDAGIWRRLRLIPFEASFAGREDRNLLDRLRGELPGIVAWCVQAAVDWYSGKLSLEAPKRVVDATADYRTEQDQIAEFLGTGRFQVTGDRAERLTRREVYQAYKAWAELEGKQPFGAMSFSERFRRIPQIGETVFNGTRMWAGIKRPNAEQPKPN